MSANPGSNPARPAPGTEITQLAALPESGARAFDFREGDAIWSVIVARVPAGVFAYENDCPHARSQMERPDGRVVMQQGRYIVCTVHGASFEVSTGACAGGPCNGEGLTVVAVAIADGIVRIA